MNTVSGSMEKDAAEILFLTFLSVFCPFFRTMTVLYVCKTLRVHAFLIRDQWSLLASDVFHVFFCAVETYAKLLRESDRIL